MKNWLTGKDPDTGRDWRQEEKGTTEDEIVGWPHWLVGHEFEQAGGVGDGQGGLVCCSPWGCKESDTIERLNWTGLYPLNTNSISPRCNNQKCLLMLPDAPGRNKNRTWLRITAWRAKIGNQCLMRTSMFQVLYLSLFSSSTLSNNTLRQDNVPALQVEKLIFQLMQ